MTVTTSTNVMKKLSSKNIVSPKGFKAAGLHCGLKHKKKDLAILVSEVPASVAGVLQQMLCKQRH